MKGIWVANPDGAFWPRWDKLHKLGVTRIYFPALQEVTVEGATRYIPNDKQLNPAYRAGVNSQGFEYAIYRDPRWSSISSPQVLADAALADIAKAGGAHSYQFDIEYHDPHFVSETIRLYRLKRPTGPISWTLEPHQGGWFTDELIDRINYDPNLVVVPQNFYGDMTPYDVAPYWKLRSDLGARGVADNRIKVFYDGARPLPTNWDGCILSEERLP